MKDNESLEHPMISKAIQRALEKVNKNLVSEIKAHSQAEWFARNIKN